MVNQNLNSSYRAKKKGKPLFENPRIAKEFLREVKPLFGKFFSKIRKILKEQPELIDDPKKLIKAMQAAASGWAKEHSESILRMAEKWAGASARASFAGLADSLSGMAKKKGKPFRLEPDKNSKEINAIIEAATKRAASLIVTIPQNWSERFAEKLKDLTENKGVSRDELLDFLSKAGEQTVRHNELLILDQTRKVYGDLNRERMQKVGIKKYEWSHHSGSMFPRKLHLSYDGKIFKLDKPVLIEQASGNSPAQYGYPGDAINCRCRMIPLSFE